MSSPIEDVGTITATWIDPTGVVWPLSDTSDEIGYFTTFDIAGWGAPTYEITSDPLARGGSEVRHVRQNPARIIWPLNCWGPTNLSFMQRYRALRNAFVMTAHQNTPGCLRVALQDGSAREIDCFYEDGFRGEAGENWLSANPVLTLFCPDGYWRDVDPVSIVRSYIPGSSFLSPFFTVSPSGVLGETTMENSGDVDAWPVWTVTGPMTSLTATNHTIGQEFVLTATLNAEETLTIVTKQAAVRGPIGENLVGSLNWPYAYLWPLSPGDNAISFSVGGAAGTTSAELSFYRRYVGF